MIESKSSMWGRSSSLCTCELCGEKTAIQSSQRKKKVQARFDELQDRILAMDDMKQSIIDLETQIGQYANISAKQSSCGMEQDNKVKMLNEFVNKKAKERDEELLDLSRYTVEIDKLRREFDLTCTKRSEIDNLIRMKKLIKQAMQDDVERIALQLDTSRWRAALELFVMMRIEVDENNIISAKKGHNHSSVNEENVKTKCNTLPLRGFSTILSLPLLNHGDYADMPIELVTSALGHTSHLVDSLSTVLNIPLPHSILPFDTFDEPCLTTTNFSPSYQSNVLFSLSPARRIHSDAMGEFSWDSTSMMTKDSSMIARTKASKDAWLPNSTFSAALALLRANITVLCLRAGIPPEILFPSQAILLNLHILHKYCIEQSKNSGPTLISPEQLYDESNTFTRIISEKYKSSRWENINSSSSKVAILPKTADSILDNARIVPSNESDWAVVDIDKPEIL